MEFGNCHTEERFDSLLILLDNTPTLDRRKKNLLYKIDINIKKVKLEKYIKVKKKRRFNYILEIVYLDLKVPLSKQFLVF